MSSPTTSSPLYHQIHPELIVTTENSLLGSLVSSEKQNSNTSTLNTSNNNNNNGSSGIIGGGGGGGVTLDPGDDVETKSGNCNSGNSFLDTTLKIAGYRTKRKAGKIPDPVIIPSITTSVVASSHNPSYPYSNRKNNSVSNNIGYSHRSPNCENSSLESNNSSLNTNTNHISSQSTYNITSPSLSPSPKTPSSPTKRFMLKPINALTAAFQRSSLNGLTGRNKSSGSLPNNNHVTIGNNGSNNGGNSSVFTFKPPKSPKSPQSPKFPTGATVHPNSFPKISVASPSTYGNNNKNIDNNNYQSPRTVHRKTSAGPLLKRGSSSDSPIRMTSTSNYSLGNDTENLNSKNSSTTSLNTPPSPSKQKSSSGFFKSPFSLSLNNNSVVAAAVPKSPSKLGKFNLRSSKGSPSATSASSDNNNTNVNNNISVSSTPTKFSTKSSNPSKNLTTTSIPYRKALPMSPLELGDRLRQFSSFSSNPKPSYESKSHLNNSTSPATKFDESDETYQPHLPKPILIDVRNLAVYQESHIRDSFNVNLPTLLIKRYRRGNVSNFSLDNFITTPEGREKYLDIIYQQQGGITENDGMGMGEGENNKKDIDPDQSLKPNQILHDIIVFDETMDETDRISPGWTLLSVLERAMMNNKSNTNSNNNNNNKNNNSSFFSSAFSNSLSENLTNDNSSLAKGYSRVYWLKGGYESFLEWDANRVFVMSSFSNIDNTLNENRDDEKLDNNIKINHNSSKKDFSQNHYNKGVDDDSSISSSLSNVMTESESGDRLGGGNTGLARRDSLFSVNTQRTSLRRRRSEREPVNENLTKGRVEIGDAVNDARNNNDQNKKTENKINHHQHPQQLKLSMPKKDQQDKGRRIKERNGSDITSLSLLKQQQQQQQPLSSKPLNLMNTIKTTKNSNSNGNGNGGLSEIAKSRRASNGLQYLFVPGGSNSEGNPRNSIGGDCPPSTPSDPTRHHFSITSPPPNPLPSATANTFPESLIPPPLETGEYSPETPTTSPLVTHPETAFVVSTILPDFLYLGPEITKEEEVRELQSKDVKRILNMAFECDDLLGLQQRFDRYLKLNVRDTVEEDVETGLKIAVEFISQAEKDHTPVYVHCKAGKSRSVTAVLAYLIQTHRWTLKQAYDYVMQRRRGICPNIGFVAELMRIEESVLGTSGNNNLGGVGSNSNIPGVGTSNARKNDLIAPATTVEFEFEKPPPLRRTSWDDSSIGLSSSSSSTLKVSDCHQQHGSRETGGTYILGNNDKVPKTAFF
ncbi:hypothetical protein G9A89_023069 [Geosiphon pyriformis]|nr:hypothetical protein G9A89_023069 [Geosiphon pyriformis]